MSASTDASSTTGVDDLRETIESLSPGDEVELAINTYDWQAPLDVVDADDPVEWAVPYGNDWFVRTIILEAARVQYAIQYSSIPTPPRVDCYRLEDDGSLGQRRGTVIQLDRVTDNDDEEAVLDEDNVEIALPDGITVRDVTDAVEAHKNGGKADLGDVASELDVSPGIARKLTYHLTDYENDIREVVSRPGGGRR